MAAHTEYDLLDSRNWISPKDLAGILGINVQTVYNKISTGEHLPPSYKKGHSTRFFRPEVEAWLLRDRRVPAAVQLEQQAADNATA